MASRSIPVIDLWSLSADRDDVVLRVRHAVIEYGAMTLTGLDAVFDGNVVSLANEQASEFFQWPPSRKKHFSILNSSSFLGYTSDVSPDRPHKQPSTESLHLLAGSPPSLSTNHAYDNLVGPNQLPGESELPLLQTSVTHLNRSMVSFSQLIVNLILEALGITQQSATKYIPLEASESRLNQMAVHALNPVKSGSTSSQGELYKPRKDASLLTYFLQDAGSTHQPVQFQDIFGEWLDIQPQTKPAITVSVGHSLEYLTHGVCMATAYKFLAPSSTQQIVIPFRQNARIESSLSILDVSKQMLKIKEQRDLLRSPAMRSKFVPGNPLAETLFVELVKRFRDVAKVWYPEELAKVEKQEQIEQDKADEEEKKRRLQVTNSTRLEKVFVALDNVLHINVPTKTADIKLFSLLPQVKSLSGLNVQLSELLQVFYIWPDFVKLKLDDRDEFIIDVDETKDMLSISDLPLRSKQFTFRLEKWVDQHKDEEVPALTTSDVESKTPKFATTRKRSRVEILKKEKPKKRQKMENGLSLLERVRKREMNRQETQIPPEKRYQMYLDGKIDQVLDIVATLRPDKPHSIDGLTEQVQNSLKFKNALAQKEARDLVLHLAVKFPDVFKLYRGRDISVLKWRDFDVNFLKKTLQK